MIPDARELRGRRALMWTIGLYAVALGLLLVTGRIAFLPKEILLPLLFVPPALAGQFGVFWGDWARFLGLIVLFDALRGLAYAWITRLGWPVYMGYAIDADRLLLGGSTGPELLQSWFYTGVGQLELTLTLVHASHFAAFFIFGLLVWHWRRESFGAFERGMIAVMYGGLLGYLLMPTVPPWMADIAFHVIPSLARPIMETYNAVVPNVVTQFDTNPIAAMPSLHCAIPTFMSLVAGRLFGFSGWPVFVYTGLVYFSVVYGGEHYVVDVIAGIALAAGAFAWVKRDLRALEGPELDTSEIDETDHVQPDTEHAQDLRARATAVFGLLLATSALVATASAMMRTEWIPNDAFVERELQGQPQLARFVRAQNAFARGDFDAALAGLAGMPASNTFDRRARLSVQLLLALDRPAEATDILNLAKPARAQASEHLYWRAISAGRAGDLSGGELDRILRQLEQDKTHGGGAWAARLEATRRNGFRP